MSDSVRDTQGSHHAPSEGSGAPPTVQASAASDLEDGSAGPFGMDAEGEQRPDTPGPASGSDNPPPDRSASPRRDWHAPLLARLRRAGHHEAPFKSAGLLGHAAWGLVAIACVGLAPFVFPEQAGLAVRLATLLALAFLFAAPGLALGMGRRAFVIAGLLVVILYGTTAVLSLPSGIDDLFVVTVVTSFLIFGLAGFNLVFVIEEMVYDVHRLIHLRQPAWQVLPVALAILLILFLPVAKRHLGLAFPALWVGSWAVLVLLGFWWAVSVVRPMPATALRELHLLAAGIFLATLLADAIHYLQEASEWVPSVVALFVLLGTWVYVSYTTLQRTHMLLRRQNAAPWLALLLAASFGIVAHSWTLYGLEGHVAVEDLVGQRIGYMVVGVWCAIALLVARGIVRGLDVAKTSLGRRGARVAAAGERVPEALLKASTGLGEVAVRAYAEMDRVLPGTHRPPRRP